MTSRFANLRRAFRAMEEILAGLPIAPEAIDAALAELPRIDGVDAEALAAFVRRANERAAASAEALVVRPAEGFPLVADIVEEDIVEGDIVEGVGGHAADWLEANLTPVAPPQSLEESLEDLRELLAADSTERLGSSLEAVRRALGPMSAPRDADWAGSALESLGVDQDVVRSWARPTRAPGWLWARIRRDVQQARTAVRARRVPVAAIAAATVVLSASLAVVLLEDRGSSDGVGPRITFLRVDRPLSDQYASATLLERLRDGR